MITLFHAGYDIIEKPDIHYGRKNADFGQGFYTTDNSDFAKRWVREKTGSEIIVNRYELDDSGLLVKELSRDSKWFEYLFSNRRLKPDVYGEFDVIRGPIANDIIFDTLGIITSGFLSDEEAMKLLMVGPCFEQIVLKTQKAADNLKFVSYEVLTKETIKACYDWYVKENERFQTEFAAVMEELT